MSNHPKSRLVRRVARLFKAASCGLVGWIAGLLVGQLGHEFVLGVPTHRWPQPAAVIACALAGTLQGVIYGWRSLRTPLEFEMIADRLARRFRGLESYSVRSVRYAKLAVGFSIVWWLTFIVLIYGAGILGRYWSHREWQQFWVLLFGPPLVFIVAMLLWRWISSAEK